MVVGDVGDSWQVYLQGYGVVEVGLEVGVGLEGEVEDGANSKEVPLPLREVQEEDGANSKGVPLPRREVQEVGNQVVAVQVEVGNLVQVQAP